MASREGGEDEFSGVRVTRVDGKSVALGDGVDDRDEIGEIDSRGDSLGVEVESESDKVDVSGSLSVSEDTSLDSVTSSEESELSGGNSSSCGGRRKR